ncbi:MAG: class I mannose-6-phosphate isomerase [Novosphingobium sp.]
MSAALPIQMVEKPWGMDRLPAPFVAPAGTRIGEVWFAPPPEMPGLLVKYIFAGERLSVQVHPSDADTQAAGLGRQGKAECWLIVDAEPGAQIGVGFTGNYSTADIRQAALDGSIEQMLAWHWVKAGDFFYISAGTVHAIGGGVSLVEVQQASDITYRLYDYGRARELHLDRALGVLDRGPHDPALRRQTGTGESACLVDGPHFRLDSVSGLPASDVAARYKGPLLVIPRAGRVSIDGEQIAVGQCGLAADMAQIAFDPAGACLIAQTV